MTQKIKLFILLFILSTSLAIAQRREVTQPELSTEISQEAKTKIVSAIPVGTKYFAAEVDGFGLTFVDRLNQISVVSDIKNDVFFREGKVDFDPEVVILFDEELNVYRVAENLMEYRKERDGEKVVGIRRSKIIELKQSKIE